LNVEWEKIRKWAGEKVGRWENRGQRSEVRGEMVRKRAGEKGRK
jgi:hypothetical protein